MPKTTSLMSSLTFYLAQSFRFVPMNQYVIPKRFADILCRWLPTPRKRSFRAANGFWLNEKTNNPYFISGLHESQFLRKVARELHPHDVVFDVGANVGYTMLFIGTLLKNLRIRFIGFEPVPETYALLERNRALNPGIEIEVEQLALGADNGDLLIASAGPGDGSARPLELFLDAESGRRQLMSVPVCKMDDFCRSKGIYPTLIFLDVEGYAGDVLRGATQILTATRPVIAVEIHDEHEYQGVLKVLSRMDYDLALDFPNEYGRHQIYRCRISMETRK